MNPNVDLNLPNYANSPNIRKFVDSLPGLGAANANNLGQYIPVAVPDIVRHLDDGVDGLRVGIVQDENSILQMIRGDPSAPREATMPAPFATSTSSIRFSVCRTAANSISERR